MQRWLIGLAAALLLPVAVTASAQARSTTPQAGAAVTDGTVQAIAQVGDRTVLGGDFDYVGESTGAGVPFTRAGVLLLSGYAQVTGNVWTAVDDGSGGVFVSGVIDAAGGVDTRNRNLVHIRADGSFDSGWDAAIDSAPTSIVRSGSTLLPRRRLHHRRRPAAQTDRRARRRHRRRHELGARHRRLGTWSADIAPPRRRDALPRRLLQNGRRARASASPPSTRRPARWTSWAVDLYSASVSDIVTTNGRVYVAGSTQQSRVSLDEPRCPRSTRPRAPSQGGRRCSTAARTGSQARDGKIYVGGSFTTAAGEPRRNLAVFDAEDGTVGALVPVASTRPSRRSP